MMPGGIGRHIFADDDPFRRTGTQRHCLARVTYAIDAPLDFAGVVANVARANERTDCQQHSDEITPGRGKQRYVYRSHGFALAAAMWSAIDCASASSAA